MGFGLSAAARARDPEPLCGANLFEYLVALQRHADAVAAHPDRWIPWNYAEALTAATR